MSINEQMKERNEARGGWTVPEFIVAAAISVLVIAGAVSVFVWCMGQTTLAARIAWSQTEAMRSSGILTAYLRNADTIKEIDEVEGTWVVVTFPYEGEAKLVYSNAVPLLRDGQMILVHTNGSETIVARGLTEIMEDSGFTQPIFKKVNDNILRIQYRVAEPASTGGREVNDDPYAAEVRFSACLRNAPEIILEDP